MAAKRIASSSMDWAAFATKIPPAQKAEFLAFKAKSDAYVRNVAALRDTLLPINWDVFRATVKVPGMVDDFKKQYESLTVPYPSSKDYVAKIEEVEKDTMKEIGDYIKQSKARVAEHQAEIERLRKIPSLDNMTYEQFCEHFPQEGIWAGKESLYPHEPDYQPGYVPPQGTEEKEH